MNFEIEEFNWKLNAPFTMLCAGTTSSGKTFFIKEFLQNIRNIMTIKPQKILYCYGTYQPIFQDIEFLMDNITFLQGIPTKEILDELGEQYNTSLIILDDLMHEVYNSSDMLHLFTQYSHHNNISVIFTTQNIYHGGKFARTITLNCHYIILFRNSNVAQIRILGQQLFPGRGKDFMSIYQDAIKLKYGYLFIDLHPASETHLKLRSNILSPDQKILYQMDNKY